MQSENSKLCADLLRQTTLSETKQKLKATHAHELIAAMFGYKSHAALLADDKYCLDQLGEAEILLPDVQLVEQRKGQLEGLPEQIGSSRHLCETVTDFLQENGIFFGKIFWGREALGIYLIEEVLSEHDLQIMDDLSGPMAETNAIFDEIHYEEGAVHEENGTLLFSFNGQCDGTTDQDKPFSGDQIDFRVSVELHQIAGKTAYSKPDIEVGGGAVNWDWADYDEA